MTDRYAVVGNPVEHSKSPAIHAAFSLQTGQDIEYGRILAPLDGFRVTVEKFRDDGGKGLNVTLPFKVEAYQYAKVRGERAVDAEAANTLKFDGTRICADNTDGTGLVQDLQVNLRFPVRSKRVLLLGAGGAAQGVLGPLLSERPDELTIANRTVDKADRLADRFRAMGRFPTTRIVSSSYEALAERQFDLVINATSASLAGELPPLPKGVFAPNALAYDMMYGRGLTPFLLFAQAHGVARLADGLGMLVEQAAESFFLWRGVRPDTRPVIDQLRTQ